MRKGEVHFANKKVEEAFDKLTDKDLKRFLERAFKDIEENPFCGIQIPKKLIPKIYLVNNNAKNAWKYDLPGAWRLIYSIEGGQPVIVTIVLEWMDHKEYERRFKY